METNELIKKKLEYFYKNQTKIHIKKKNNYFHNGKILELAGDLIIFDDEKTGAMPIYFLEIFEIEKRKGHKNNQMEVTK